MGVFEIISAVLLILACVFIVAVVLMQDSKQGMSQTITGASADNYYQKNSSRTKEAKLNKMTKAAAVIFFVVALLVNVVAVYMNSNASTGTDSDAEATTTLTEEVTDENGAVVTEDTTAGETSAEDTTAEDTTAEETTAEDTSAADEAETDAE